MANFNPKIITGGVKRNKFDLSYYSRITSRMGDLVPVLCKKIVPSDEYRVNISSITRLAPLANPVYDRLRIDFDAFFVQNRIIDPNFKEFLTGGIGLAGQESTEFMQNLTMKLSFSNIKTELGAGTIYDYLGFSYQGVLNSTSTITLNAEPILGYYKIFEDWYRNERFDSPVYSDLIKQFSERRVELDSVEINLFRRRYDKDPYTTALSEPLIGGPIPIMQGHALIYANNPLEIGEDSSFTNRGSASNPVSLFASGTPPKVTSLRVDLSSVASNTVQQLNQMYALYRFFMTDTYNGNRYVEFVKSHFGVVVPDSTLERPLFLGRLSSYVNFSEIFQTSGSTGESNTLGDYAGKGAGITSGFLFQEKFLEHGYLYIIMSIVPESTYFQGVSDVFLYGDRFDSFYFPEFQNIGDDVVSVLDIYSSAFGGSSIDLSHDFARKHVFGYNRRNYRLIYYPNEIHGSFRESNNMRNWTFAREFSSAPTLGSKFSEIPSINNPFVYTDAQSMNFFTDILFKIDALRPVERYESITTH